MFPFQTQNHKHKLTDLSKDINPKNEIGEVGPPWLYLQFSDLRLLLGLFLSQTTKISDDRRWF